jgi:hypothetical protein
MFKPAPIEKVDCDGNEVYSETIDSHSCASSSDNNYHFSQAVACDYYHDELGIIVEEVEEALHASYPLGRKNRLYVLLETNLHHRATVEQARNHARFELYTDLELGIDSDVFDNNIVDSVSPFHHLHIDSALMRTATPTARSCPRPKASV